MTSIRDKTYVHFGKRLEQNASRIAERVDGVVLTGQHTGPNFKRLRLVGRPTIFQEASESGDVLPTTLFSPDELWLSAQTGSVAALTNPVDYLPSPKDHPHAAHSELARAISGAHSFRRVAEQHSAGATILTLFAFHHHWLTHGLTEFRAALREVDGPIGLMVSHDADPFASPRTIEGMLDLVREFAVSVLRTDTAGIGFRSFGAPMTSIGVGTGTRHFPSPDQKPFANLDDDSPRLFVPAFGDFWRGTRIAAAESHHFFRCYCGVCGGMSLARFIDPSSKPEAAEHTIDSWMTLSLEMENVDASKRGDWWTSYVLRSLSALHEFEDDTYSVESESQQLRAWTRALGVGVS